MGPIHWLVAVPAPELVIVPELLMSVPERVTTPTPVEPSVRLPVPVIPPVRVSVEAAGVSERLWELSVTGPLKMLAAVLVPVGS